MKQVPFRVMCVRHPKAWAEWLQIYKATLPAIGSEYTVIEVTNCCSHCTGKVYRLQEHETRFKWAASAFATLPSESEEVAIEAESEAIIYQR